MVEEVKKSEIAEFVLKNEEIKNSDLAIDKKIMNLPRKVVPKYTVQTILKKEEATKSRIKLEEQHHHLQTPQKEGGSKKEKKKIISKKKM